MRTVFVVSRKIDAGIIVVSVHNSNEKAQQKVDQLVMVNNLQPSDFRIDAVNMES